MEGFHYLNVTFRIDCYPKAQIKRHVKSQCFSCFVFFKLTKELHSRAAFCTDRSLVEGPLHLPSPETQNAGLEDEWPALCCCGAGSLFPRGSACPGPSLAWHQMNSWPARFPHLCQDGCGPPAHTSESTSDGEVPAHHVISFPRNAVIPLPPLMPRPSWGPSHVSVWVHSVHSWSGTEPGETCLGFSSVDHSTTFLRCFVVMRCDPWVCGRTEWPQAQ